MVSLLYKNEKLVKEFNKDDIIFKDLNLDIIINEILRYSRGFDIEHYFYEVLVKEEDVLYRQAVLKDFENSDIYDAFNLFSYTMKHKIDELEESNNSEHAVLKQIRLKQKITDYINILKRLDFDLDKCNIKSEAIKNVHTYIKAYLSSEDITFIINDMNLINEEMKKIKYRMGYKDGIVKIAKDEEHNSIKNIINPVLDSYPLSNQLTFNKNYGQTPNHILAQMYNELSKYYPKEFKHLELYSKHFNDFIDSNIKELVNEVQFYSSYIALMKKIMELGLEFNYPNINEDKIYCNDGYDLALAISYIIKKMRVIPNSFSYEGKERIIIVSGPNQGGKTTFSRFLGQTFYLSLLGLKVTGSSSSLKLVSNICTMYEVLEDSSNLNGKLKSELIRIKQIMDNLGDNGLLIMNEVFSSTSLHDGIILGKKVIDMLNEKNAYAIFVTFIEELSNYNDTTVSMGSTVDKDDPSIRTFEILRRLDNSNAYARSIAKKNEVSYEDILRRIE
ncbi:MAG: hypothetical protein ACI35W_06555 [Anaeroplasmataceae bacterium]